MNRSKSIGRVATTLAAAILALIPAAPAAPADEQVVAIRGATILTVTKGTIEGGTVLVRGGKIADVGKDLAIPAGAKIIEARKRFLIPGIVDVHSHLGVYPWPGTDAN